MPRRKAKKARRLTAGQQKLVEDHYRVVKKAIEKLLGSDKGRLIVDVIGGPDECFAEGAYHVCRIAHQFDESRGKFSTLCVMAVIRHLLTLGEKILTRRRRVGETCHTDLLQNLTNGGPLFGDVAHDITSLPHRDDVPLRSDVDPADQVERIRSLLPQLCQLHRKIVGRYLDGKTTKAIARDLGVSRQAVQQGLSNARRRLRRLLNEE